MPREASCHSLETDRPQDCLDAIARVRHRRVHPESNVLIDCEMRKEAVILRDVREATLLRRAVDAGRCVEPDLLAKPDETFLRAIQPGKAAKDRGLARSRRTEQHRDAVVAGIELQVRADANGGRVPPEERRYEPTGHVRPERRC